MYKLTTAYLPVAYCVTVTFMDLLTVRAVSIRFKQDRLYKSGRAGAGAWGLIVARRFELVVIVGLLGV